MTAVAIPLTGASSAYDNNKWDAINWQTVVAHVRRLQMRIAKAYREGKKGKVQSLQRLLTHSYYGDYPKRGGIEESKGFQGNNFLLNFLELGIFVYKLNFK